MSLEGDQTQGWTVDTTLKARNPQNPLLPWLLRAQILLSPKSMTRFFLYLGVLFLENIKELLLDSCLSSSFLFPLPHLLICLFTCFLLASCILGGKVKTDKLMKIVFIPSPPT